MSVLDKIYRDLAKEFKLNIHTVTTICNSVFKFTHERIAADDSRPIELPYFGKFKHKYSVTNKPKDEGGSKTKLTKSN